MKRLQGFTLIELMVVIAIIAILTSLAITAYSKSIGKAQLSEAFTITDGLKTDVSDYYHQTGLCPSIGDATGGLANSAASYSGHYVANADVTSAGGTCVITATMRSATVIARLQGKQVVFTLDPSAQGSTRWSCSSDADQVYLPQTCQ